MKSIEKKREHEQQMVSEMIYLYCRKKHHSKNQLCKSCSDLERYAKVRSQSCPYIETKTFCSSCKVHCYKSDMREEIHKVMRFSGPRIIFLHPIYVFRHLIETIKFRRKNEN